MCGCVVVVVVVVSVCGCGCGCGCACFCCVCDECLVQSVIFRAFQLLTTVDVKTRTIFYSKKLKKNNSPKLFAAGPAGHKNISWISKNIQSGATPCI